jgi:hypothetical protein
MKMAVDRGQKSAVGDQLRGRKTEENIFQQIPTIEKGGTALGLAAGGAGPRGRTGRLPLFFPGGGGSGIVNMSFKTHRMTTKLFSELGLSAEML